MYYATILTGEKTKMRWTKQHSKNAVAAKARLRRERFEAAAAALNHELREFRAHAAPPHFRAEPDFKITIEARGGERTRIFITRIGKKFLTTDGFKSARQIARGIEMLLRHCSLK